MEYIWDEPPFFDKTAHGAWQLASFPYFIFECLLFYCPHLLLVFTSFITPFCESIRILTLSTLPTLQAKQRLWPLVVLYEKKAKCDWGIQT